jgi:exonuclease III
MNIISWNVRGLNAPSKHRMLRKRIIQEKAEIVMLQETKCDMRTIRSIAQKVWKGCAVEVIEAEGASGGLAILWDLKNSKC